MTSHKRPFWIDQIELFITVPVAVVTMAAASILLIHVAGGIVGLAYVLAAQAALWVAS